LSASVEDKADAPRRVAPPKPLNQNGFSDYFPITVTVNEIG